MAFEEDFWATPRLCDEGLFPFDVWGEEVGGDGALVAVTVGLVLSSSEESPPAKAKSSASKSAMMR